MAAISTIQFKRGTKSALTNNLKADKLGIPLAGEPLWEMDTNKLKIGNGVDDYEHLGYITGGGDFPVVINDPVQNQILVYDSSLDAWKNITLSDEVDHIYFDENGHVKINGYDKAENGQMLIKGTDGNVTWATPVSSAEMTTQVTRAYQYAESASAQANKSESAALEAKGSAAEAKILNQKTLQAVNDAFWWGTIEEYNALESINPGTIYHIRPSIELNNGD